MFVESYRTSDDDVHFAPGSWSKRFLFRTREHFAFDRYRSRARRPYRPSILHQTIRHMNDSPEVASSDRGSRRFWASLLVATLLAGHMGSARAAPVTKEEVDRTKSRGVALTVVGSILLAVALPLIITGGVSAGATSESGCDDSHSYRCDHKSAVIWGPIGAGVVSLGAGSVLIGFGIT